MNSVQDVIYNWLTIKVVSDARPEDTAAIDTLKHFERMLKDEYHISKVEITHDEVMYYVAYQQGEDSKKTRFPRELIEVMLDQISREPEKYENFPIAD